MGPFPKRDRVNIQIPDDVVEEFRQRARSTGDSVNRLIEQALRDWLRDHPQATRRDQDQSKW